MGLLDKLKHGLQGSGVHTEIDGPGSISSDQPGIDLVISFTANEGPPFSKVTSSPWPARSKRSR